MSSPSCVHSCWVITFALNDDPQPRVKGGPLVAHLPRASTDGSLTRKLNEIGVRFWTDPIFGFSCGIIRTPQVRLSHGGQQDSSNHAFPACHD